MNLQPRLPSTKKWQLARQRLIPLSQDLWNTRDLRQWATILIGAVTGIVVLFFAFIEADRYVVETKFMVRDVGAANGGASMPNIPFIQSPSSSQKEDALAVIEYIRSYEMYEYLDRQHGLGDHLSGPDTGWFGGASRRDSREDKLKEYRSLLNASYDDESGLVTLDVAAYTPQASLDLTRGILAGSERFIERLSGEISQKHLSVIEDDLAQARDEYRTLRAEMVAFQTEHGIFDPEAKATMLMEVISRLEAELASDRARLMALLKFQSEQSIEVRQLRETIAAKESQIMEKLDELVSGSQGVNQDIAQYRQRLVDLKFAEETYAAAIAAHREARTQVAQDSKIFAVVVAPSLPEEATEPQRLYNIITALIIALVVYAVVMVIVAAIKEQYA